MEKKHSLRHHPLMTFLGSMNLAITLLVMLAVASVIGTVLKQNEAYSSYVIKFGPFWFEVFRNLELYDVYSAIWFLSVLAFLLASISACVWRNGGYFLKDMLSFQEDKHPDQLKKMNLSAHWTTNTVPAHIIERATTSIQAHGFKTKTEEKGNSQLIAAKKGSAHRLGYFFTHLAIIVICLGALLDSNLKFKFQEWAGMVESETRSLALTDVNPKANLTADNFSFRGSVNIPEGKSADVVFLTFKDGYLVQKLPFEVKVIDFRVESYDTGMPKSFESDIILTAPDLKEPIKATLSVNKPLIYKDYSIYQSSFGDGGSRLKLNAYPLATTNNASSALTGEIHRDIPLNTPIGDYKIELDDYKPNNVIPLPEPDANGKKVKNLGPSVQFKVRDSAGQAVEYENYLLAIDRDQAWYQVSKFRKSRAQEFDFLMIPLDTNMSMKRFMTFLSLVNDQKGLDKVLDESIAQETDATKRDQLTTQKRFMQQLINLFRARGFDGIKGYLEQAVEADKREAVFQQYLEILTVAMQSLYLKTLELEGIADNKEASEAERRFFADSVEAMNLLAHYGPPMFFEITSVDQRESSGLQITKSPGKNVVFLGSFMLIVGVFLLFYVRPQRIWLLVHHNEQGETEVVFAGKDGKDDSQLQDVFSNLLLQNQSATTPLKEPAHVTH